MSARPFYLPSGLLWAESAKPRQRCRIVRASGIRPLACFADEIRRTEFVDQAAAHELYVSGHGSTMAKLLARNGTGTQADIGFVVECVGAYLAKTDKQLQAYVKTYPNRPAPHPLYFWAVPQDIHALASTVLVQG